MLLCLQVIELTQVTSGADIWSVGCLIIELLTGYPPYYDLQPMSALFRIVQDDHPVLPEGSSAQLLDFLLKCFQKVGSTRLWCMGHPAGCAGACAGDCFTTTGHGDSSRTITSCAQHIKWFF